MAGDETRLVRREVHVGRLVPAARLNPWERAQRVKDRWLGKRKPGTIRAYQRDLAAFRTFLEQHTGQPMAEDAEAIAFLLEDQGRANEIGMLYAEHLEGTPNENGEPYKSATISRYISSLRSLVRIAHKIGIVNWRMDVDLPKVEKYRDTRGPGDDAMDRLFAECERAVALGGPGSFKALRDYAMIRVMFTGGLRRGEVAGLDVEHVDRQQSRLLILGKGRMQREAAPVSKETMRVLVSWMAARAERFGPRGPLFVALDPCTEKNHRGGRLTTNGIWYVVHEMEEIAGVPLRPHGIRHAAITKVADKQGVTAAMAFARHKDPRVTLRYIDNLVDKAAEGASAIEESMHARKKPEPEADVDMDAPLPPHPKKPA